MPSNYYMYFVAALIPILVGALYYSPAVAGKAWMKTNGFEEKDLEGTNMIVILGLSYLLGIFISFTLGGIVIHQTGVFQMMMPTVMDSGSEAQNQFNTLMQQYGGNFRTFGHGALHGTLLTIFFVMPLLAINSMFERRGWKYIMIHTGYWLICLILIGGLLCQTLEYAPLK